MFRYFAILICGLIVLLLGVTVVSMVQERYQLEAEIASLPTPVVQTQPELTPTPEIQDKQISPQSTESVLSVIFLPVIQVWEGQEDSP